MIGFIRGSLTVQLDGKVNKKGLGEYLNFNRYIFVGKNEKYPDSYFIFNLSQAGAHNKELTECRIKTEENDKYLRFYDIVDPGDYSLNYFEEDLYKGIIITKKK